MGRPSDWWVLDLDSDPTPGDPVRVRELAGRFSSLSADAFVAAGEVRRQAGEGGVTGWLGEAGAVFTETIGEFPGQLDKLDTSYGMVGRALTAYAGELETAQSQADAALVRGREARGRLDTAQGQVAGVETEEVSARTALSTASGVWPLTEVPASWSTAPPPGVDPSQVRTHTDAATRLSGLRTQVSDAQGDVDAERALAVAARSLRETAASTCKGEIDRASDAGIQNRSFWDRARDFVSDAWDVLVKLAEVVIVVAAIAALVLGGPVLWTLVVVAAAVVLADKLMAYANGEASLWDVGFALLNFVPGGKALTLSAGLARGASRLRSLGGLVRGGWGTARNMAGGLRGGARTMACRIFGRDPVDVVSGQVFLAQTDVELPGLLPLVLERAHLSTYRHGRHFGPNWASTLDQRLEVDGEGVCLPLADGTILTYPPPLADGTPVLPVEGVRWPLAADPATGGWTVTDPQTGRALHFPPATGADLAVGQVTVLPLAAVGDRNGHRFDVDRAPDGTPTAVRHTGGYHLVVDTTPDGQVAALRLLGNSGSDGDGDGSGGGAEPVRLVEFGYDADGRLAEVVNSSGLPLRFGYDPAGRLTGWTDRNHSWYAYAYDDTGRCVRTTGPDGYLTGSFTYRPAAGTAGVTGTTVVTDSLGHQSRYEYNSLGQVVRQTDPLGNTTSSTWDRSDRLLSRADPLGRSISYEYDTAGNLVQVVQPDGLAARATYDELCRPIAAIEPDGAHWQRSFDDRGNLIAVTDPLGATTTYLYDSDRPGHLTSVTNPLGFRTRVATNDAGLPTQVTLPSGGTTSLIYGTDGRMRQQVDPVGGITSYDWTPDGRLASRIGATGATERWSYDGEGNLVEYVDAAGLTTTFEYTHFDLPSVRTSPDGSCLTFQYDTELRMTSVTNQQGLVWSYEHDPSGRLVSEIDFDGHLRRYDYDRAGHVVTRSSDIDTVSFIRDEFGAVVEERSRVGSTRFDYDRAGRVRRAANAAVECSFVRDPLGRVVEETVNGRTTRSTYDLLGRRVGRMTPSGLLSEWSWDADGLPLALRVAGRTVDFVYDAAGRETGRILDTGVRFVQDWDAEGRLISRTVTAPSRFGSRNTDDLDQTGPDRQTVHRQSYAYTPDGYLTASRDLRRDVRSYTLDMARRVTAVVGAGWQESYGYDNAGNLTHATWPDPQILDVESVESSVQGERVYNGTRLVRAGRVRYEYDSQGRTTLRQQQPLSGQPRTWRYSWDPYGRLVGVVTPDGNRWRYVYDPFGRRIMKERVAFDGTVGDRTHFTWDGLQLVEQVGETDGRSVGWEWEPGGIRPVVQLEQMLGANVGPDQAPAGKSQSNLDQASYDIRFYAIVTDLVGAPSELIDESGDVVWRPHTTLWGVPAGDKGRSNPDCPLRFPGQYHDPESGFAYNLHRHYDPTSARYQSLDPLGLAPAPNPTAYVENPTDWIDPLGLTPCQTVLFGQRRISASFSSRGIFNGRSIYDVAADLRSGVMTADDVPVNAFRHHGRLVAENNRSLAALSLAGLSPTRVTIIESVPANLLRRLREPPLIGPSTSLPSTRTAVTPSQTNPEVIDVVRIAPPGSVR